MEPYTFLSWGVFRSAERAIASRGQVRPFALVLSGFRQVSTLSTCFEIPANSEFSEFLGNRDRVFSARVFFTILPTEESKSNLGGSTLLRDNAPTCFVIIERCNRDYRERNIYTLAARANSINIGGLSLARAANLYNHH